MSKILGKELPDVEIPSVSPGNGLREHILMASRFLRNPRTVGAVSASSRAMARMMVAQIPTDRPVTVVELGPGLGTFTRAIVERAARGSKILAMELEPQFVEQVKRKLPMVDVVCGNATELERVLRERHLGPVDHFVSGLPFATVDMDDTRKILDAIQHTLKPGGTFTTFAYLHGYGLRPGRLFRQQMSERMGGPPERHLFLRNFPLSFILTWRRPSEVKS